MQKTDHFAAIICQSYSFTKAFCLFIGKIFWSYNSTLSHDETYIIQMKEYMNFIRNEISDSFAENSHVNGNF